MLSPDISLLDESLDKENTGNYNLNIQLSFNEFTYCIIDSHRNKYIALEHYSLKKVHNHYQLCNKLDELFTDLKWLSGNFNKTKVLYIINKSTLIPVPLFNEDEQESYFNFNHTLDENEDICCDKLNNLSAFNIYAIPHPVKIKIKEQLLLPVFRHHLSALVESLLILNRNQHEDKKLYINVNPSLSDVIVLEDNKLLYNNTFEYHTPEDFIYYVLFAIQQLNLNPETIEVVLTGEIQKNSAYYDILYKYIRNISFAKRNDAFEYSYVFKDLSPHNYFNLLNSNLME